MTISPAIRRAMRPGSAINTMRPASNSQPRAAGIPRKMITDKLGVPEDATDDETLAALDARLAANRSRSAANTSGQYGSPDDALYAAMYGPTAPQPSAEVGDDALYREVYG